MRRRVLTSAALIAILTLVLSSSITGAAGNDQGPAPQAIDPEAGLVIVQVDSKGPAAEGGVVRGDILQAIDDEAITNQMDLRQALREREAGEEVELTILHGDDLRTIPVTLGEQGGQAYLGLVPFAEPSRMLNMNELLEAVQPASGALIIEVVEDSPAEEAGLQPGTVITAVDDLALDDEADLAEVIGAYKPGDTVKLAISSPEGGAEPLQVEVTLAEHPDREGAAFLGVSYRPIAPGQFLREDLRELDPEDLPFDVQPFQRQFRFQAPGEAMTAGVLIRDVAADSPAEAAGLQARDIITAVDGVDAWEIFRQNLDRVRLLLLDVIMPRRGGYEFYQQARNLIPGIRVLFVSGYNEDSLHTRFVIKERMPFIRKPYEINTLLQAVRDALVAGEREADPEGS